MRCKHVFILPFYLGLQMYERMSQFADSSEASIMDRSRKHTKNDLNVGLSQNGMGPSETPRGKETHKEPTTCKEPGHELRGTTLGLNDQFSRVISDWWKVLQPILKQKTERQTGFSSGIQALH